MRLRGKDNRDEFQLTPPQGRGHRKKQRRDGAKRKRRRIATVSTAIVAAAAIIAGVIFYNKSAKPIGPLPVQLPASAASYLGIYAHGAPASYAAVTEFAKATGTRPDVVMYYSGWFVPFPVGFATATANDGAVPLVQMDPDGVNLAAIASGRYDGYLSAYAEAIRAYRHPVILGFGHEMNGDWYSWSYRHTRPTTFVAA
jgi:hypothetical protein